jgi:hypothetical protein
MTGTSGVGMNELGLAVGLRERCARGIGARAVAGALRFSRVLVMRGEDGEGGIVGKSSSSRPSSRECEEGRAASEFWRM